MREKYEKIDILNNNFFYWEIARIIFLRIWRSNFGIILGVGLSISAVSNIFISFPKIVEQILSFITTFCICYLFFIPLTVGGEEICHSFIIFKKKKILKKFFLEIRSICSANNKTIFIKNCSVNFEGKFTYLDYIHFLGGGPIGVLLFLIVPLPITLSFISNKMFLNSGHLFIIYFLMTVIPINSLFIGKESDGRKAFRIAKENEMGTFEFIYEFIKGAFILFPFPTERANLKKK